MTRNHRVLTIAMYASTNLAKNRYTVYSLCKSVLRMKHKIQVGSSHWDRKISMDENECTYTY